MQIIVCVKQVPDTAEIKINPETNTIIRQGVASIVNPFDKNAIEAALQLKEKHGGIVTVISMGPSQAKEALKECLAMGADNAILISDRAFGGSDTLATSYTLAAAIKKIGKYDVVLCGKQAIDGDTAQVGPEIAEHLGIAQVTYVSKIDVNGEIAMVEREHEAGYDVMEVKLPAMITVIKSLNYEPRFPSVRGTMKANRAEVPVWTANDLEVNEKRLGLKGSPTQVRKIFSPPRRTQGVIIQKETVSDAVDELMQRLSDAKIL